jgi:hypothetical protein
MAANAGHLDLKPCAPLGASQNWQKARYGAPTRQAPTIPRTGFLPGTANADSVTKKTMSDVSPRRNEKQTFARVTNALFMALEFTPPAAGAQ